MKIRIRVLHWPRVWRFLRLDTYLTLKCTVCGFESAAGDFDTFNESWACPICKTDESGLEEV